MSFDPREWIDVAEKCREPLPGVSSEASLRTATGRAYYSALMRVVERIGEEKGTAFVNEGNTHSWVLQVLKDSRAGVFLKIRNGLLKLRDLREEADYGIFRGYEESSAEEAILRSRNLIRSQIDSVPPERFRNLRT